MQCGRCCVEVNALLTTDPHRHVTNKTIQVRLIGCLNAFLSRAAQFCVFVRDYL